MSITISEEQKAIIAAIRSDYNVIVEAVAGSGKTTLVLEAAKLSPDVKFIQLTYNSALKSDTRRKVNEQRIKNLEVHSYHSLARKYYDNNAHEDSHIEKILTLNIQLIKPAVYDVFVVDEAQDMTFEYYKLIKKFLFDSRVNNASLVIMGDRNQAINEYRGSDHRYLTLANNIIGFDREWKILTLTMSYRMTSNIGSFVQTISRKEINTCKPGPKIIYLKLKEYGEEMTLITYLYEFIVEKIESGQYVDEDIFILVPSLKKSASGKYKNFHFLEHKLKQHVLKNKRRINCYSPDKEENYSDSAAAGKIVFSTLNGSKGRERRCVIVFQFDSDYFEYYGKDLDTGCDICPNIHYVATSRASEQLIVIQSYGSAAIQYIDKKMIRKLHSDDIIDIGLHEEDLDSLNFTKRARAMELITNLGVTEMASHIKHSYLTKLTKMCEYEELNGDTNNINLPATVQFDTTETISPKKSVEELSAILGVAMPMSWEFIRSKKCTVINMLKNKESRDFIIIADPSRSVDPFLLDISSSNYLQDVAKYAIDYVSVKNGFTFKILQILNLEWFTPIIHDHCISLFDQYIPYGGTAKFEIRLCATIIWKNKEFKITGFADYKYNNIVWEFKCISQLSIENLLQLAIYAFLIENCNGETNGPEDKINFHSIVQTKARNKYKLFNCKNGMIWELMYDDIDIKDLINTIFESKQINKLDDAEFIQKCLEYTPSDSQIITRVDLKSMTLEQLKQYCRDNKISGFSKYNKADLITYIRSHNED